MVLGILFTGCEGGRTGGTATAAALVVDSRGRAVGSTYQIFVRNLLHKDMLALRRRERLVGLPADFSHVQIGLGLFLLRRQRLFLLL